MGPVSKNAVVIGFGAILVELRQQRATLSAIKSMLEQGKENASEDQEQLGRTVLEHERRLRELERLRS
jgi:hypothetical protein